MKMDWLHRGDREPLKSMGMYHYAMYVYTAQGKDARCDDDYEKAEECFLKAGKPGKAVDMYVGKQMWADALRVAEAHGADAADSDGVTLMHAACAKGRAELVTELAALGADVNKVTSAGATSARGPTSTASRARSSPSSCSTWPAPIGAAPSRTR